MSHQQPDHHVPPGPMLIPMTQLTVGQVGLTGGVRTEQHGNQIVHVRGDSDSDLEALFSVLRNIDGRPPASSFKNRKLPASFFRPPDHPKAVSGGAAAPVSSGAVTVGQTVHGRSVSSPAQLHHGSGNGNGSNVSHGKSSGTVNVAGTDNFINELAAPPHGPNNWDATKNCQRYYPNPSGGIWQPDVPSQHGSMPAHPVAVYQGRGGSGGSGNGQTGGSGMQPLQHPVTTPPSTEFSHQEPLPHGWEQGITSEGEIYYINHVDKTTSWYDPRIPRHRQATAPIRVGSHPMVPHPHAQHQQQPQQSQQQQHSHLSPKHQQHGQCHQMVAHQQLLSNGQHAPISGVRSAHSEHFICLELQKLHKEKERLQQEQEAINCREMMLNELVRQTTTTSPCGGGGGVTDGQMKCGGGVVSQPQQQQPEGALAMLHTMQSLYGTALNPIVDSFAGTCGGGGVMESHARQNSTDSGLGGMGTTYSLPRSPDDYLSNVDEMDMQEDVGHTQKPINNSCYLQMAGGGASGDLVHGHMHLTSVGDMIDGVGVVDGDHLFSSLAGDVSSDLLSDMDVQKIDNILYL